MKLTPEGEFQTAFFEALEYVNNFSHGLFNKLHPLTAMVFFGGVALSACMLFYMRYLDRKARKSPRALQ